MNIGFDGQNVSKTTNNSNFINKHMKESGLPGMLPFMNTICNMHVYF